MNLEEQIDRERQLDNELAHYQSRDYDRLVDLKEEQLMEVAWTWDLPILGKSVLQSYPLRALVLFEKYWEPKGPKRQHSTGRGIALRRSAKAV